MLPGKLAVAGYLCADLIVPVPGGKLAKPGYLVEAGPLAEKTGGAVANTGLGAAILGIPTVLIGRVGDDGLGKMLVRQLKRPNCTLDIIRTEGIGTSYSIVNLLGAKDRSFVHYAGPNRVFASSDIDYEMLRDQNVKAFHFGYPPLMDRMYADDGSELVKMFKQVSEAGIFTSLDMVHVDEKSPARQVNWQLILQSVLRHVDLFAPTISEIGSFLPEFQGADEKDLSVCRAIAERLLSYGAKAVMLKRGKLGLYFRSGSEYRGLGNHHQWLGREIAGPPFQQEETVDKVGTGDLSLSGLYGGMFREETPKRCLQLANAVSSCSVEGLGAISGVRNWDDTCQRVDGGWKSMRFTSKETGWKSDRHGVRGVYSGPHDCE